jgi:hypothetical protein
VGGAVLFNEIGIWVWKAVWWVWDRGWEAVAVFVGYGYHGMYVDMLDKGASVGRNLARTKL